MKRAFDLVTSAAGLMVLAPFLLFVGLAVLLTSGRPVLFVQERVGLGGRPFKLVKFRTMAVREGAESGLFEPGSRSRVTPVGRVLRASKIDELPQLWNVLRGRRSAAGSRPSPTAGVGSSSSNRGSPTPPRSVTGTRRRSWPPRRTRRPPIATSSCPTSSSFTRRTSRTARFGATSRSSSGRSDASRGDKHTGLGIH
jgi:hypothetical protein